MLTLMIDIIVTLKVTPEYRIGTGGEISQTDVS